MIGKTISHYKTLEKLGEGGMGVVYKAEDTKLKRTVALKFLTPQALGTEEEKTRFVHEAQAAAALNHSNIMTIYEIDEEEGETFIAMEYVEGVTLKDKLETGPLKTKEVLNIAIPVAEALNAAHSKEIIHRDIKSENIMVSKDGQVKIMDFGLAKRKGETRITKTGSTLGTLAYMSPEQAEGLEVDHRSDLFSFGVVMYETATGQLPFKGEHDAAILYAIVNEQPLPVTALNPNVPPDLGRIIHKALEKEPEDRYQHADEMLVDLRRVRRDTPRVSHRHPAQIPETAEIPTLPPETPTQKSPRHLVIPGAILTFIILFAIAIFIIKPFSRQSPPGPMQTTRFTSYPGKEGDPAFSPDGNHIAFVWDGKEKDNSDIYIKTIAAGEYEPQRLTDHPNADYRPAWSPDGKFIAFHRLEETRGLRAGIVKGLGSIYLIPAFGGHERRVISGNQPDWSPDGKFLAFCDWDTTEVGSIKLSISLLNLESQEKQNLTEPPTHFYDYSPKISPDGEMLAFLRSSGFGHTNAEDIYVGAISDGKWQRITFDNQNIRALAWTHDSRDIIFSSDRGGSRALWRILATGGEPERLVAGGDFSISLAISPDGRKLSYSKDPSYGLRNSSIWRYEIPETHEKLITPTKLIYSGSNIDKRPVYSPDGERIAFISYRSGERELWTCDKNGLNPIQLTYFGGPRVGAPRWSSDGKSIVFDAAPDGHRDIFTIPAEGGIPHRITTEASTDHYASWSRDSQWIYFSSNRSGAGNIWKVPSEGGKAIQLTTGGGNGPLEFPEGKWLFYNSGGTILKIPIDGGEKSLVFQFPHIKIASGDFMGKYDWVPFEDGIFFQDWDEVESGWIRFYDFASDTIKKVVKLHGVGRAMDVSPDRRYVLYAHEDEPESDLMLVENWR